MNFSNHKSKYKDGIDKTLSCIKDLHSSCKIDLSEPQTFATLTGSTQSFYNYLALGLQNIQWACSDACKDLPNRVHDMWNMCGDDPTLQKLAYTSAETIIANKQTLSEVCRYVNYMYLIFLLFSEWRTGGIALPSLVSPSRRWYRPPIAGIALVDWRQLILWKL